MSANKSGGDGKGTGREAAPDGHDPLFRDYPLESSTARIFQSLIAPEPVLPAEPAAPEGEALYARGEKKRAGALTPEMIRRIADRAEAAAGKGREISNKSEQQEP